MSKSVVACTIDTEECSVVRLKTSSGSGYILSACKTMPYGLGGLASGKRMRFLQKLDHHLKEWRQEELALCVAPEIYLPLPTCFPIVASPEECSEYCGIEAGYFLNHPEEYRCDCIHYGMSDEAPDNRLLLFYSAEPCRTASEHFSTEHRIVFKGTSQLPLLYLSRFTVKPQIILELENNYVLLTISNNGRMEKFSCRPVKNLAETEYFAIRELINNPICRETEVQIAGTRASKAMITLIEKKTSLTMKPISIPQAMFIGNPQQFKISSPTVIKAISAALMALEKYREPPNFS